MIRGGMNSLFMLAEPVSQHRFLQEMRGLPEAF